MPLKTTKNSINESELLAHFQRISPTTQTQFHQKRPYISSALCPRQLMLNGTLPTRETEKTPALKYYGGIGNAVEKEILDVYESNGSLLISGWKLPSELFPEGVDLGAKLDAIIMYRDTPVLVDIKTVGIVDAHSYAQLTPEDIQALQKGDNVVIMPDDERIKFAASKKMKQVYEAQLQLYCAITGLDNGFIMSISRRVQDTFSAGGHLSTTFTQIDLSEQNLIKRVAVLLYGIKSRDLGQIPSKLAGIKKTHCKDAFCDFVPYCFDGGPIDANIDFSAPFVTPEDEKKLKLECLEIAKGYVANRASRVPLTLSLAQDELTKRQHINEILSPLRDEAINAVKDYNVYPWDVEVKVKW